MSFSQCTSGRFMVASTLIGFVLWDTITADFSFSTPLYFVQDVLSAMTVMDCLLPIQLLMIILLVRRRMSQRNEPNAKAESTGCPAGYAQGSWSSSHLLSWATSGRSFAERDLISRTVAACPELRRATMLLEGQSYQECLDMYRLQSPSDLAANPTRSVAWLQIVVRAMRGLALSDAELAEEVMEFFTSNRLDATTRTATVIGILRSENEPGVCLRVWASVQALYPDVHPGLKAHQCVVSALGESDDVTLLHVIAEHLAANEDLKSSVMATGHFYENAITCCVNAQNISLAESYVEEARAAGLCSERVLQPLLRAKGSTNVDRSVTNSETVNLDCSPHVKATLRLKLLCESGRLAEAMEFVNSYDGVMETDKTWQVLLLRLYTLKEMLVESEQQFRIIQSLSGPVPSVAYVLMMRLYCTQHLLEKEDAIFKMAEADQLQCTSIYTEMIHNMVRTDRCDKAISLVERMNERNLGDLRTQVFIVSKLHKENRTEDALTLLRDYRAFHCQQKKCDESIGRSVTSLIRLAGMLAAPDVAHRLLELWQQSRQPCVPMLNSFFSALQRCGQHKEVVEIFKDMRLRSVPAGLETYHMVMRSYEQIGDFKGLVQLPEQMALRGVLPSSTTYNRLIGACVKGGELNRAKEIFRMMPAANCQPTEYSYNIVMKGHLERGELQEALEIKNQMQADGLVPNTITFLTLAQAAYSLREYIDRHGQTTSVEQRRYRCTGNDIAISLMEELDSLGLESDAAVYDMKVKVYCRQNDLNKALATMNQMREKGFNTNNRMFNLCLDVCGRNKGQMRLVPQVLSCMSFHAVEPDVSAYIMIIRGYSKMENVRKAFETYDVMIKRGLTPDVRVLNSLIRAVATVGDNAKVLELVRKIHTTGTAPNVRTFAEACVWAKVTCNEKATNAIVVVDEMQKADVVLDSSSYEALFEECLCNNVKGAAMALFDRMLNEGVTPTVRSIEILKEVCARTGRTQLVSRFEKLLEHGILEWRGESRSINLVRSLALTMAASCRQGGPSAVDGNDPTLLLT